MGTDLAESQRALSPLSLFLSVQQIEKRKPTKCVANIAITTQSSTTTTTRATTAIGQKTSGQTRQLHSAKMAQAITATISAGRAGYCCCPLYPSYPSANPFAAPAFC